MGWGLWAQTRRFSGGREQRGWVLDVCFLGWRVEAWTPGSSGGSGAPHPRCLVPASISLCHPPPPPRFPQVPAEPALGHGGPPPPHASPPPTAPGPPRCQGPPAPAEGQAPGEGQWGAPTPHPGPVMGFPSCQLPRCAPKSLLPPSQPWCHPKILPPNPGHSVYPKKPSSLSCCLGITPKPSPPQA